MALRRVNPPSTRIAAVFLKQWRTKGESKTSVSRKCFLVGKAIFDVLPEYPFGLAKWIIPRDQASLPVD
eukprot:5291037-Lingulodinium_polyedra.AAC.1